MALPVGLSFFAAIPTYRETIDGFTFWNPGSMTLPKRGYPRSWAVYENGTFTVKDFEGGTVLSHTVSGNGAGK